MHFKVVSQFKKDNDHQDHLTEFAERETEAGAQKIIASIIKYKSGEQDMLVL